MKYFLREILSLFSRSSKIDKNLYDFMKVSSSHDIAEAGKNSSKNYYYTFHAQKRKPSFLCESKKVNQILRRF